MKLGVNIDHVATLRQARLPLPDRQAGAGRQEVANRVYPDPVTAARICQEAGAHSIVMHLREDRRHIQESDLFRVKEAISIKLNLEMSIAPSVVKVARALRPDQVTFVPERRQERTTESGLNLFHNQKALSCAIEIFRKKGVQVSLFIDPEQKQIIEAKNLGAGAVEFHTGGYANARALSAQRKELGRIATGVLLGGSLGLVCHAGHGLDYHNVQKIKKIQGLEELNIGYSIVTRALWVGLKNAVQEMVGILR